MSKLNCRALALSAAFVTWLFGVARAESPPTSIYVNRAEVALPRRHAAGPSAAAVRWFVARDDAAEWRVALETSPRQDHVQIPLAADGRYAIAERVVQTDGSLLPAAPPAAEAVVIVDTRAPQLSLELSRGGPNEMVGTLRATDPYLDPSRLRLEAWQDAAHGERVVCRASEVVVFPCPGGVEGRVVWLVPGPTQATAKVTVADLAGNEAEQIGTLTWDASAESQPLPRSPIRLASADEPEPPDEPALGDGRLPALGPMLLPTPAAAPGENPRAQIAAPVEDVPPAARSPAARRSSSRKRSSQDTWSPTDRRQVLLRAARNAVALGDLPRALERFDELLQAAPEEDAARCEYAGLLTQAGRLADARKEYEMLVAADDGNGEYRLALADLLLRLQDYDAAQSQLKLLLGDTPWRRPAAMRLARSFVAQSRGAEARQIYDRYFSNTASLAPTEKLEFARLLVDMDRPEEALRLIVPLAEAAPGDEKLQMLFVLANVRKNNRVTALEMLQRPNRQPLKDTGGWLQLGLQLYKEQAFPEALAIFEQLTAGNESHSAQLWAARARLRLYEVESAKQILESLHGDPNDHEFAIALVDAHTVAGEYAEAIAVAARLLRENPGDVAAGVMLGNAYYATRQYYLADGAYQSALAACPTADDEQRRHLRWLIARNHARARNFDQAIGELEKLIAERSNDVAAKLLLIDTLIDAKHYAAAEALIAQSQTGAAPRLRCALAVALGYLRLDQGRDAEAAEQFRALSADPNARLPEVAYGWARAARMLDQPDDARAALALGPSSLAPAAAWGVGFADRASERCDCALAAAVLDDALHCCPTNVCLLNSRGEAAQTCSCDCRRAGCPQCKVKIFQAFADPPQPGPEADEWFVAALRVSPTNVRARLGVARVRARLLEYEASFAEYQKLLRQMPLDVNLIRETARLVEGWRGLHFAAEFYAQGAKLPADAAANRAPLTQGFGVSALGGQSPEQTAGPAPSSLSDLEFKAKFLRIWRPQQAVGAYENLVALEPTNEAACFDLAQTYSGLNRTRCAIQAYQRVLAIDPCNQDAAIALARAQLELRPKAFTRFTYLYQDGRQGLANISIFDTSFAEQHILGDENEWVEVGYRERILMPPHGPADWGEIPYVRWQEKTSQNSLLFAELDVEQFSYGFHTRPTFMAGGELISQNDSRLRVWGFLNNVYANAESIRQDIYRVGMQAEGSMRPLRRWELTSMYRAAYYSDFNASNEFLLRSSHLLLEGRRRLRGISDYSFTSFAKQTVFSPFPDTLVGTIHPYFAPHGFSFLTTGLEWKEWLSCDSFKGANEFYYLCYAGAGVDSNSRGYFLSNAAVVRDVTNWFSCSIESHVIAASVYHETGAVVWGIVRFR